CLGDEAWGRLPLHRPPEPAAQRARHRAEPVTRRFPAAPGQPGRLSFGAREGHAVPALIRLSVATLALCGPFAGPPAAAADDKGKAARKDAEEPFSPYKHLLPLDEVIKEHQARLRANPKDANALAMLGNLHVRKAREEGDAAAYDRAGECFKRLQELDP